MSCNLIKSMENQFTQSKLLMLHTTVKIQFSISNLYIDGESKTQSFRHHLEPLKKLQTQQNRADLASNLKERWEQLSHSYHTLNILLYILYCIKEIDKGGWQETKHFIAGAFSCANGPLSFEEIGDPSDITIS